MKEENTRQADDKPADEQVQPSFVRPVRSSHSRGNCGDIRKGTVSLANVGRELLAPLGCILDQIDQVLQTPLTPLQSQHLEAARTSANHLQLLIDDLSVRSSAAAARSTSSATACRPLRILVAEDNVVNRVIVKRMLSDRHHLVQVAVNGREAVEVYERECFDLVLMDLHMPEMDGLEATARLRDRQAATGRRVPIVALTACATDEDRIRCLAAGMADFLTKPIQIAELLRVLVAVKREA